MPRDFKNGTVRPEPGARRALKQNAEFFGDRVPKYDLTYEKPWHRQACDLALTGLNDEQIALIVAKSRQQVRNVLRQDFARTYMAKESKKRAACDEIRDLLEVAGPQSLRRIINLAEKNENTALGFDADKEVLNRLLGRPTQPITQTETPVQELSADELEQQVGRIVAGLPTPEADSG